jgi:hypothetical protein
MSSFVEVKWGISGRFMHCVVIRKLSYRKPIGPVILSMIDEHSQILFYLSVYLFCLAISLGVVGGTGVTFYSQELVELLYKSADELGASVTYNLCG